MRDKKRKEKKLLEEAYDHVYSEGASGALKGAAAGGVAGAAGGMLGGPLAPLTIPLGLTTGALAGGGIGAASGDEEGPLAAFDGEECGSHVETDIAILAAQAIAAITELATAAGANLSVTVETEQEEVHNVELPIVQFNTGYEDVEET